MSKGGKADILKGIRTSIRGMIASAIAGRAANKVYDRVKPLVDTCPGWKVEVRFNDVKIERSFPFTPEDMKSLRFMLNMVEKVDLLLDTQLSVSSGYGQDVDLTSYAIIRTPVTLRQRLYNMKAKCKFTKMLKRKFSVIPNGVFIYVNYGKSSDCAVEIEERTETITTKRAKLVGDCAEAIKDYR